MKIKTIAVLAAAACATVAPLNLHAIPITGNIGFDGTAQLDAPNVQTATEVISWIDTTVGKSSGAFAGIPIGTMVSLASPWTFDSGPLNNFWTVGGFTFNLLSSSGATQSIGGILFLNVSLSGRVTGNGFDPTDFSGTFQTANPSANGQTIFTERLSFGNNSVGVPDGALTATLLGLTCLGLGLFKYKFSGI
jgi:hypothetical protein